MDKEETNCLSELLLSEKYLAELLLDSAYKLLKDKGHRAALLLMNRGLAITNTGIKTLQKFGSSAT